MWDIMFGGPAMEQVFTLIFERKELRDVGEKLTRALLAGNDRRADGTKIVLADIERLTAAEQRPQFMLDIMVELMICARPKK